MLQEVLVRVQDADNGLPTIVILVMHRVMVDAVDRAGLLVLDPDEIGVTTAFSTTSDRHIAIRLDDRGNAGAWCYAGGVGVELPAQAVP
jgi:hypothetical protein